MEKKTAKKYERVETDFERAERKLAAKQRKEEALTRFMSPEAKATMERRRAQAGALWSMYLEGQLELQTIEIVGRDGSIIRKDVFFSHHSKYAV